MTTKAGKIIASPGSKKFDLTIADFRHGQHPCVLLVETKMGAFSD